MHAENASLFACSDAHHRIVCVFSSSSRPPVDDKAIGENRHDNIEMRSDVRSYEKRSY